MVKTLFLSEKCIHHKQINSRTYQPLLSTQQYEFSAIFKLIPGLILFTSVWLAG